MKVHTLTDTALLSHNFLQAPTAELVDALSTVLDEPDWLRDHRLAAISSYQQTDWPNPKHEEWRRTPMCDVPLTDFCVITSQENSKKLLVAPEILSVFPGVISHQAGKSATYHLDDELTNAGVVFLPLSQAARTHEVLVREHLNKIVPVFQDRFTALTSALWSQGIFCYIPKNVTIQDPFLHLLQKSIASQGIFGHTLIIAEENTTLTLLESASSEGNANDVAPSLSHRTIEISAGQDADIRVIEIQDWGPDVNAFVTERTTQDRGSRVQLSSAIFGGRLSKESIDVNLVGKDSEAEIIGVFIGQENQHIEYNTRQEHRATGTKSNLLIKGALLDDATAVQYGLIKIFPEGQQASGFQTMRNLLLSEGASADPIPILEIEADDVQCSHAAAVGPVDPDQIFYLQSRGIPKDQAQQIVVRGFLEVATTDISNNEIRTYITNLIEKKLRRSTESEEHI